MNTNGYLQNEMIDYINVFQSSTSSIKTDNLYIVQNRYKTYVRFYHSSFPNCYLEINQINQMREVTFYSFSDKDLISKEPERISFRLKAKIEITIKQWSSELQKELQGVEEHIEIDQIRQNLHSFIDLIQNCIEKDKNIVEYLKNINDISYSDRKETMKHVHRTIKLVRGSSMPTNVILELLMDTLKNSDLNIIGS